VAWLKSRTHSSLDIDMIERGAPPAQPMRGPEPLPGTLKPVRGRRRHPYA